MLEEYLCLGGTEVANNARTYGYATSTGCPLTWFRCEPCESIRAATSDWVPPIYRTTEYGRNLATNPNMESGVTGWGVKGTTPPVIAASAEQKHSGTQSLKVTSGAGTANGFGTGYTVTGLTVGVTYTMSGWVYNLSAPVVAATVATIGYGTDTTVVGQWVRLSMTFIAQAASHNIGFDAVSPPFAANQVFYVDDVMLEVGSNPTPYFDGSTPNPTDVDDIFWLGATNASVSVWERQVLDTPGHIDSNPYEAQYVSDAPWYDADVEASSRFYGVFILTVENLNSSTRTATVTEGILDGGVVGLTRHATREMRTRAILVADGEDALEYGLAWLKVALATSDCQTHGSACGAVDLQFFAYCPDAPNPSAPPDNDGSDVWDAEIRAPRYIHNVTVISGPLVEQKIKSNNERHVGYIVEWTMVAGTPWVFGTTTEIGVNPSVPTVIQDEPFNLMPYPSAELASGTVIVQTNYVTNPSIETDASGWTPGGTVITPAATGARSTEIAAVGVASYKVAVTATNAGTAGTLLAWRDVTLPAAQTGQRFSATTWAALFVVAGTAVLTGTKFQIEWRNATTALRTDGIGSGASGGGSISAIGLTPPAGATIARVVVIGEVASWSVGAQINLFVDAVAVTLP